MSSELVPFIYDRNAWNVIRGTSLQAPNSLATSEQIRELHRHFRIEIYVGAHGVGLRKGEADPYDDAPSTQEYEAVRRVVDGLRVQDTLFVECYGFWAQPPEPWDPLEVVRSAGWGEEAEEVVAQLQQEKKQDRLAALEAKRESKLLSAWEYAAQLAQLRDVRVLYADHDAFDAHILEEVVGRKACDILFGPKETEKNLIARIDTQRECRARNYLKDWGLTHMSAAAMQPHDIPRLVLLFGSLHTDGLSQAFALLGWRVDVLQKI